MSIFSWWWPCWFVSSWIRLCVSWISISKLCVVWRHGIYIANNLIHKAALSLSRLYNSLARFMHKLGSVLAGIMWRRVQSLGFCWGSWTTSWLNALRHRVVIGAPNLSTTYTRSYFVLVSQWYATSLNGNKKIIPCCAYNIPQCLLVHPNEHKVSQVPIKHTNTNYNTLQVKYQIAAQLL